MHGRAWTALPRRLDTTVTRPFIRCSRVLIHVSAAIEVILQQHHESRTEAQIFIHNSFAQLRKKKRKQEKRLG
jgi:hypothetical protein